MINNTATRNNSKTGYVRLTAVLHIPIIYINFIIHINLFICIFLILYHLLIVRKNPVKIRVNTVIRIKIPINL